MHVRHCTLYRYIQVTNTRHPIVSMKLYVLEKKLYIRIINNVSLYIIYSIYM